MLQDSKPVHHSLKSPLCSVRLDQVASFIVNANRRIVVNNFKSARPLKAKQTGDDSILTPDDQSN
jgi:hypothetical protein